jgi:hypothetical protein
MDLRWFDLVVKCLIKVTKTLPACLPDIHVPDLLLRYVGEGGALSTAAGQHHCTLMLSPLPRLHARTPSWPQPG